MKQHLMHTLGLYPKSKVSTGFEAGGEATRCEFYKDHTGVSKKGLAGTRQESYLSSFTH